MPNAPEVPDWYSTAYWHRLRQAHLKREPICRECQRLGIINDGRIHYQTGARLSGRAACLEVDHIIPHRGDRALFADASNLQTLCNLHHAEKTLRDTEQLRLERQHAEQDAKQGFSGAIGTSGWPESEQHPVYNRQYGGK